MKPEARFSETPAFPHFSFWLSQDSLFFRVLCGVGWWNQGPGAGYPREGYNQVGNLVWCCHLSTTTMEMSCETTCKCISHSTVISSPHTWFLRLKGIVQSTNGRLYISTISTYNSNLSSKGNCTGFNIGFSFFPTVNHHVTTCLFHAGWLQG